LPDGRTTDLPKEEIEGGLVASGGVAAMVGRHQAPVDQRRDHAIEVVGILGGPQRGDRLLAPRVSPTLPERDEA